jgi:hypothetical protein
MTKLSNNAIRRISESVSFTERIQLGTKVGMPKRRGSSESIESGIPVNNLSTTTTIPVGGVMYPPSSTFVLPDPFVPSDSEPIGVTVPDVSTGAESSYLIAIHADIPPEGFGHGKLSGVAWAKVNIRDATDPYAQVIDGDATRLESTAIASRAKIIKRESGTGEKWCRILLSDARSRWFKGIAKADIDPDDFEDAQVYVGAADTGEAQRVYLDWVHDDEKVSSALRLTAVNFDSENHFEVIQAQCEPVPAAAPADGDDITATNPPAQATAGNEEISHRVNRITIVGTANDSVTLMPAIQGEDVFLQNDDSTDTLQIFPASGEKFNNGSVDASVTLAAGSSVHYFCIVSGEWLS